MITLASSLRVYLACSVTKIDKADEYSSRLAEPEQRAAVQG